MTSDYDLSEYDQLPPVIKYMYSPEEWMWLPANEKAHIIEDNTVPEAFDD